MGIKHSGVPHGLIVRSSRLRIGSCDLSACICPSATLFRKVLAHTVRRIGRFCVERRICNAHCVAMPSRGNDTSAPMDIGIDTRGKSDKGKGAPSNKPFNPYRQDKGRLPRSKAKAKPYSKTCVQWRLINLRKDGLGHRDTAKSEASQQVTTACVPSVTVGCP